MAGCHAWQAAAMVVLHVLAFVAGLGLALATLLSAVRTVVLPRAVGSVITRTLFVLMRRLFDLLAGPNRTYEARDRIRAYYAPLTLVMLPGLWIALIIVAFTAMMWGTGGPSLREAFLTSGSSVLTLGVAFDRSLPRATLTFIEATLGLGLVALLISYLPSMYGSFNRRETLVGGLEVRAGTPPSAAAMLTRYSRIGWLDDIDKELFPRWEDWFLDIEESHTSLPPLVFFRSPHPNRSWVTAAGCVLDTAAIVATTLDRKRSAPSEVMMRSGFLCLRRIADLFELPYPPDPRPDDPISVTRREYDLLCVELVAAGIALKADRDQAWLAFAGWRVNYDAALVGLARLVDAPEARWSGDRSAAVVAERRPRRPRRSPV
jgi:hypothetical protein